MSPRTATSTVAGYLRSTAQRLRKIESLLSFSKPEYIVAHGGYIVGDTAIGATTVTLNTYPRWANNTQSYVVFDAGTTEAEIRKITSVSPYYYEVTFADGLSYAHADGDPVLFLPDSKLNVFWFGASGDGTTDDTLAFQRAFDQFQILAGNDGEVYVPSGEYLITATITVPQNFTMKGESRDETIFKMDMAAGVHLFTFNLAVMGNVRFANFKVEDGGSGAGCHAIYFVSPTSTRIYFQNIWIDGVTGDGIHYRYPISGSISDCVIENCGGYGLVVRGASNIQVYRNRISDNSGVGIHVYESSYVIVSTNIVKGSGGNGIHIQTSTGVSAFSNIVSGNATNIYSNASDSVALTANLVLSSTAWGIDIPNSLTPDRLAISGNLTQSNASGGIRDQATIGSRHRFYHNKHTEATGISLFDGFNGLDQSRSELYSEFVDASLFTIDGGTPTLTTVGSAFPAPAWSMPSGSFSSVGVWFRVPDNLIGIASTLTMKVFPYVYSVSGGGNTVFGMRYLVCAPGGNPLGAATAPGDNVLSVSANSVYSVLSDTNPIITVSVSGYRPGANEGTPMVRLSFYRNGASGSDVNGNAVFFWGLSINFE